MKKETNGIRRESSWLLPEIISAAITIKFNLSLEPGCHQKHAGTNFARPAAALEKRDAGIHQRANYSLDNLILQFIGRSAVTSKCTPANKS
jgi:hypothetical protein